MKKLFSYLLISSMVVLSSCTNYDDQFDDLNSQITSLKSQLDGFASLSSGLTALQGTVASLQSAVAAIPTTQVDISDLEANVTALQASLASASTSAEVSAISTELAAAQAALASAIADNATAADTNADSIAALETALEAVTATLAELKTALDAASTSDDISTLTADLALVQADLTELLSQNNIYSTAVEITDDATLDFADALGNKLNIVNAKVEITQTAEMDAEQLQTVMSRIKTVTGLVTFDSTDDATTTPSFDNLTSVTGVFTITQEADVSLPKLKTASTLTITDHNDITSISAPLLETYTTLGTTSHAKVTNYSMPALKRFSETQSSGAFTLTVDGGTVDFSSVVTLESTTIDPEERADDITINGATIVKAPKIVSGKLTMNSVVEPNLPLWEGKAGSKFAKAKKVVLPSITGGYAIVLEDLAEKATYFHMIGNEYDDATSATSVSTYPTFKTAANTTIETLIIDGDVQTVDVNGATDLTSYTHTGKSQVVKFIGNTSMSSVTFGHTTTLNNALKGAAVAYGTLTVTGNSDITSVSAPELDDISQLTITDNESLTTLSFPKLNSLGKDSDGTAIIAAQANVNIHTNALEASNIQLPSLVGELPVVKGKITSDSGINDLAAFIKAAVALRGTLATQVTIDKVASVTDKDGDEVDPTTGGAITLPGATAGSLSDDNTQTWLGEDELVHVVNLDAGDAGSDRIPEALQRATYGLSVSETLASDDFISIVPNGSTALATVTFDAAFKSEYGITDTFVSSDIDTWAASAEAELNAQLTAGSYAFETEIEKDFGTTKTFLLNIVDNGVLSPSGGQTSGNITFTYGGRTLTNTVAGTGDSDLYTSIVNAINDDKVLSGTVLASTVTGGVKITPQSALGSADFSVAPSFSTFNFAASVFDATSPASTSYFLNPSVTINNTGSSLDSGYRLTVINKSTAVKANNLEDFGGTTSFTTISNTNATNTSLVLSQLVEGTSVSGTDNDLYRIWDNATKEVPAGDRENVEYVNISTWL